MQFVYVASIHIGENFLTEVFLFKNSGNVCYICSNYIRSTVNITIPTLVETTSDLSSNIYISQKKLKLLWI